MPVKTFMGNDHRRDHSFRIPRPDQSVVYGTPNTCTGCHTDKSNPWAAKAIQKWYGPARVYHFSDDLLPGSLLTDKSEKHLVQLLRNNFQPEIARATAVQYLGSIQTSSSADALVSALKDKKALGGGTPDNHEFARKYFEQGAGYVLFTHHSRENE